MFLRALVAFSALVLASCGSVGLPGMELKPYRIEIQQGNFVSQEMVSQLKSGMSKDQVRFVLGTPLITDSFHADRWDYVFRRQKVNSRELEQRQIAVFFEDGKLKRVEGDVKPRSEVGASGLKQPESRVVPAQSESAAPGDAAKHAQEPPQEKSWWQQLKERF